MLRCRATIPKPRPRLSAGRWEKLLRWPTARRWVSRLDLHGNFSFAVMHCELPRSHHSARALPLVCTMLHIANAAQYRDLVIPAFLLIGVGSAVANCI